MSIYETLNGLTPDELKNYAALMLIQTMFMLISTAAVALIVYVLRATALTRIARKLHLDNYSVAWIPLGHAYVEGMICDTLKSINLDKSNMRIHYTMLNIIYAILNVGYLYYNTLYIWETYYPIFETGDLNVTAFENDANYTLTFVFIAMTVLSLVIRYFKLKTLIFSYICFDKKTGFIWVILSLILPEIIPFIYMHLAKLEPVNTSIEKFNIIPKQ